MSSSSSPGPATSSEPLRARGDWRLILGPGHSAHLAAAAGARNMAVDHALHESVQRVGSPVLRLYLWDPPCLSLGRNQLARGIYAPDRLATAGIDLVRRPTGGLAVLHDRELTYCVLAPAAHFGGARSAYQAINRALLAGLARLGAPAQLAGGSHVSDPRRHAATPCFQAPAAGEVVAAGRKLVGSAQRCEHGVILQHGSILIDGSQASVLDLLAPLAATVAAPAFATEARIPAAAGWVSPPVPGSVTLRELLGRPLSAETVGAAVRAGFEAEFGIRLAPDALTREERVRADQLECEYAAGEWTWRK